VGKRPLKSGVLMACGTTAIKTRGFNGLWENGHPPGPSGGLGIGVGKKYSAHPSITHMVCASARV